MQNNTIKGLVKIKKIIKKRWKQKKIGFI